MMSCGVATVSKLFFWIRSSFARDLHYTLVCLQATIVNAPRSQSTVNTRSGLATEGTRGSASRLWTMVEKRAADDELESPSGTKRARSQDVSPAPASNGVKAGGAVSIQEQIAAAKARAAAARERLAGKTAEPSAAAAAPPSQSAADAVRARLEAMKKRVAAATSKPTAATPPVRPAAPMPQYQVPQMDDGFSRARGGLGIGLHPALMADTTAHTKSKNTVMSKFPTSMGNRRAGSPADPKKKPLDLSGPNMEEIRKDPYYDATVAAPRNRKSRDLLFNQKGKYIAQAAALRRQAALEEMKKRIAESARKAGLDEDRSEQAFIVAKPPAVEWWDEGLIVGEAYPDFNNAKTAEALLKISTADSVITSYVQHPVLLTPPQEKLIPAPKPMYMTKEEQAKKRRQDRMEINKEKQAKVRLGLEPPEPPKVKLGNLMRVLGDEAIKDPTAVEARVKRESDARAQNTKRRTKTESSRKSSVPRSSRRIRKGTQLLAFMSWCSVSTVSPMGSTAIKSR
ncbi:hypothetical protein MRB53_038519 [Persea americana]|nr:hypothetical protein MRB53_038519 [Persea americana]